MDEAENTDGAPQEEKSFLRIVIHSFFIIPFLIAVFCVILFAGIHLLTREQRSAYDYLEDVKTGGATKRWQGAFELSRILANPKLIPQEERFSQEMIRAFEEAKNDDPRTRQYIALAMGRTGNAAFTQPLLLGLKAEKEVNLPALIYALGMLRQKDSAVSLYPFLGHPNSRIRSIAVAALGNIADPRSKDILKKSLKDPEPNVQWGSAVSLAQMDDMAGKAVLLQMLDRHYWDSFSEVDREEQNNLILTAIESAALFDDSDLNEHIMLLAESDSNLKIRAAAQAALK